jgi:hypothetical protein
MGDMLATHRVLPILSVRSEKTILPLFVVFVAVSSCSCEVSHRVFGQFCDVAKVAIIHKKI